jgi:DNA-binding CsgD family transcriptional regulator
VTETEPWHPLTAREFEVARLISEGRTNAEIAEELGIAPKTASSHVEHILAKLGASRRAEIATWTSTVSQAVAR